METRQGGWSAELTTAALALVLVGAVVAVVVVVARRRAAAAAPPPPTARAPSVLLLGAAPATLPMWWLPEVAVFGVRLMAGAGAAVAHAVVDGGSSRCLLASEVGFQPGGGKRTPCGGRVAYVSHAAHVETWQDTVVFPDAAPGPLAVRAFPVSVATTAGAVSVLGLSAVRAQAASACHAAGAFESPLLQALVDAGAPPVWSVGVLPGGQGAGGGAAGWLRLAPAPAGAVQCAVPLVPALDRASTAFGRVPGRYFVVALAAIEVDGRPLAGVPRRLVVDTGTTQTLLPGAGGVAAVAQLLRVLAPSRRPAAARVHLVLAGGVRLALQPRHAWYGPSLSQPALAELTNPGIFSVDGDVGVLGCMALGGRVAEFDAGAGLLRLGGAGVEAAS